MHDWQKRVIDEKSELEAKQVALSEFMGSDIFAELPLAEKRRMRRQDMIMILYSGVLSERIEAFVDPS